jgi:hypothetical protein
VDQPLRSTLLSFFCRPRLHACVLRTTSTWTSPTQSSSPCFALVAAGARRNMKTPVCLWYHHRLYHGQVTACGAEGKLVSRNFRVKPQFLSHFTYFLYLFYYFTECFTKQSEKMNPEFLHSTVLIDRNAPYTPEDRVGCTGICERK